MSGKPSVWKQRPDGKTVRRNSIAQHFASRPVELLESPVLRVLSQYGHLALLRIELELRRHGGHDNGKLIVTTRQFVEYGIERRQIPAALRELEALGIVIVTQLGPLMRMPALPIFFRSTKQRSRHSNAWSAGRPSKSSF
jgi:hypothetical protein